MRRNGFIAIAMMAGLLVTDSCLEPYSPPVLQTNVDYLVVGGFANGGTGPSTFKLSRTSLLSDDTPPVAEANASVQIEGEDGTLFPHPETTPGTYSSGNLTLNPVQNYRLKIKTIDNKEYVSDFVPVKKTPAIDTIRWGLNGSDFLIYVNSHDDANSTHYYFWTYDETWTYTSAYYSGYKLVNNRVFLRSPKDDVHHCWNFHASTQILINSTKQLSRDVVSDFPLITMPLNSDKLQFKYSVLVKQVALTREAFEYFEQLRKNTENIGTLFGPLPTQLTGNIHCLTNPGEPVIGYFNVGLFEQKRIFVSESELPSIRHHTAHEFCELDTIPVENFPQELGNNLIIDGVFSDLVTVIAWLYSSPECVDCRLEGGTTIKPDYWK